MEPKPIHLGPQYGAQFKDESIALAYDTRPPYPAELFDILEGLVSDGQRIILDLGCGTGDVALGLARRADRVDAVDASEAMLRVARTRPGADHPRLHWTCATVEAFVFRGPYSLVVAAESLHWMDWEVVLQKIAGGLRPRAFLALVAGRSLGQVPWAAELARLVPRYSTNREYRPYDLVGELTRRGLFREIGRLTTGSVVFQQSIDRYVESFHTRNGFSRERMTPESACEFDDALRRLLAHHCPDGPVRGETSATVVWGDPCPSLHRGPDGAA